MENAITVGKIRCEHILVLRPTDCTKVLGVMCIFESVDHYPGVPMSCSIALN